MGKASRAYLLLLLLASSLSFAQCPVALRQVHLAGVIGESEGGIFTLIVETRPGNGSIYASIEPLTGYSTQESMHDAVRAAFSGASFPQGECDVLFNIKGDFGGNRIDGPSAGAAMALATKAALLGKKIRKDVVVTGTVSPEGNVGEVGGIIEKSTAASDWGARYIIVPSMQVYESFLLASISGSKNFTAIEANSLADAERVAFSDYSESFSADFSPESKPIPENLPEIKYDAELGRFSLVAKGVVDELEKATLLALASQEGGADSEKLSEYFSDEVAKYREQIRLGYPFTAANAAFLLSIDAGYVRIAEAGADIDGSFQSSADCVLSLGKIVKTRENIEWAIGADLRRIWAETKLNESLEMREDQGGYMTLRDLFYSQSWCGVSKSLASQAGEIGGEPINESLLAPLASERLSEAEDILYSSESMNYDALWHLENGFAANGSGDFGAAIYEATYARTMQEMANDGAGANASSLAEKLLAEPRSSLWGKIYSGQGGYLYYGAKEGGFAPSDAYRILKYSSELDRAKEEMTGALSSGEEGGNGKFAPSSPIPDASARHDGAVLALLSFYLLLFGSAIVVRAKNLSG